MKLFVTGGAGYIGSVLVPMALDSGHEVRVLDRFFFGRATLPKPSGRLEVIEEDIRTVAPSALDGCDAVIDLAAISNDPSGELDPTNTFAINHLGRVRIASLARAAGVPRYVLPSSCSIYGFQDGLVDEASPPNPLTTYAEANLRAENDALALNCASFSVVVLRQATVYGLSRRMRFDLAINGMLKGFFQHGKIPILRDGTQWRPMVHVRDTSRALLLAASAPPEQVAGQIFNVGTESQNYQIYPLAQLLAKTLDIPFAYEWYGSPDHRSYRVRFDKIRKVLGFRPKHDAADAAREIWGALKEGIVDPNDPKTITLQWYKKLIADGIRI